MFELKTILKWLLAIVLLVIFLKMNNQYIVTSEHIITDEKIPESFDGFRIVQVSDLHDAVFGENNERLVKKVSAQQPDVIFITGDVIDSRRYNLQQSLDVVEQFVEIAPTYFVTGNHEVATNDLTTIYSELQQLGVHTLINENTKITRGNDAITISGLEDPLMNYDVDEILAQLMRQTDDYTILLSHRPEIFETYVKQDVDLVLAGHAHGGQIRIPFLLEGTFSPGQGLFPKYTAGLYMNESTQMIVSRGLGNSEFQQRIFNFPELVTIILKKK